MKPFLRLTVFFLMIFQLLTMWSSSASLKPLDAPAEVRQETTATQTTQTDSDEAAKPVCAIPPGTTGKFPLKIVSFNVNTYYAELTDERNWHKRKDALCKYMLSLDADVICTQETPDLYRDYFAEKLGGVYGWEHFNHNMVFYRLDRFEKLNFSPYYYGTDSTKKAPAYDASMERNFTVTHLREKNCGAEFYVVATHFDHKGLKARIFAAKQLVETLSQSTIPYVLCGDFNSTEESYAYKDLTQVFLDTAKVAQKTDSGRTFNKWGENGDEGLPIDFIFVSPVNMTVQSFEILRDRWGANFLYSDHYPICTELEMAY